jgi:hypothetical protein
MKYLIMAHRYRTNEYIFPVGIFFTRETAIEEAEAHRAYRGGKYDHKLYEIEEGREYDGEDCKGEWVTGMKAQK